MQVPVPLKNVHEATEPRLRGAIGESRPANESARRIRGVPDVHQRRAFERATVPPEQTLRFVVSAEGVNYVEASVVDISLDGIGILQAGPNVSLEAGMLLKGCRIEIPDGDSLVVDVEVRHTEAGVLADGTPAQRAGCRFLNLPQTSTRLIESIERLTGKKY